MIEATMTSQPDYISAHSHSIYNRTEIHSSSMCGCFSCLRIYPPAEINNWIEESPGKDQTAMCPHCEIDSVIGDASGYPITSEFLQQMYTHWFSKGKTLWFSSDGQSTTFLQDHSQTDTIDEEP